MISIEISTNILSASFRQALKETLEKYPGPTGLSLFLVDPKTHYRIEFNSKKYLVSVTPGLVEELTKLGVSIV